MSSHDPNALYFVSSKFHRFFLKNLNPNEINTRIIRIGNVVQSTPFNYASTFQAIPQFNQNSLIPSPQHHFPTPGPSSFQGFHHPSYPVASPSPQSVVNYPNPNYSYYNFVNQYPTSRPYPSSLQSQPQPTYATAPSASPVSFPSYNHQSPVTSSFYNFRGSTPYAFDRFDLIDRRNSYSSYHNLNAGESQPTAYANINFEGLKGEIYRPTRNVSLLHRHWL